MKLSKRLFLAWKMIFNKSSRQTIELNNLFNFLGINPDEDERELSEATYFACMKILCESVGKLPLKILRHTDKNGVEAARKHPLYYSLNSRPNPFMTATTFWSTVEFNRNHFGNAYVWIQGAGANLKLWILPTTQVTVYYDDAKVLAEQPDIYYRYKDYVFGSEEIMHFKTSNTLDGIVGISVREQLRSTIKSGSKAQKMLNKMYDSGFTAKAVLNYTGSLNDANVQELVRMTEAYGKGELKEKGIENIIPIPLGFNLSPLNIKLADNQFMEIKQYTALQIASAFGIKPYQIGDYSKSSYASAEAQQLSFLIETLLYPLKQYEEEISYKLLSKEEIQNDGLIAKFNIAAVLRADLKTQIETLSLGVSNFIYTPNEARALLDLEAKEGGDKLVGNGASIPITMVGSQYIKGLITGPETEETPNNEEGGENDGEK